MKKPSRKTQRNKIKRLKKEADRLYQMIIIKMKPKSIVSGKPTEVGHHFIPKSQSNNLRYDYDNGVPLTNGEHYRHHYSGDPAIVAKVLEVNGQEWFDDLQQKRRTIFKLNIGNLEKIIKVLQEEVKQT